MNTFIAAGFLVAFLIMVIAYLNAKLKRAKDRAARYAALAKTYEEQFRKVRNLQEKMEIIDKRKAPESVRPPVDNDERLDRLNRLSEHNGV